MTPQDPTIRGYWTQSHRGVCPGMGSRDHATCGLGAFRVTTMVIAVTQAAIPMGSQVFAVLETLETPVTRRLSAVFMATALMSNVAMDRRPTPTIVLGPPRE